MRKLVLVALGAAAALALAACGSSDSSSTSTTAASSTTSTTAAAGGGQTIKLAADPTNIAYDTKSLSAKPGNATIDFNNPSTSLPHDVCVEDSSGKQLGCTDPITNSSSTLALSGLKAGKYTFFCSVDSHRQAGMVGTLTVK
ncbi:MAG: plastocyanin/azurin family copper-binding protein [Solirubrobacterales bacterium]